MAAKLKAKVPSHIAWRKVESEVVVLDLNTSVYWSFNEVASRIWELLIEGNSPEDIAKTISDEYDVAEKEAGKDAQKVIASLKESGLIV